MSMFAPLFRWLYTLEVPRDRKTGRLLQAAALPWCRRAGGKVEVLLITTRTSGKWTIPRGWTLRFRSLSQSAKREALQEAGVRGFMSRQPLGHLDAPKTYRFAGQIDWLLAVYALEVTDVLNNWKEADQRERRWFSAEEAAELVRPSALGSLILELAATKQRQPSSSDEQRGTGLFMPPAPKVAKPERGERRHDHADLGSPR